MKKILLLTLSVILFNACKDKESRTDTKEADLEIHDQIAIANGFKQLDSINKIKFTFNVAINDTVRTERRWSWDLNNNEISLMEKDSTMSYIKKDSITVKNQYIDRRFVNDSYWLLFPFQLKWSDADISDVQLAKAPISKKEMHMLTVSYPSDGGYTPGDSYDIYYNEDFIIQEWVYKAAGGGREMATTWEDYEDFEGIKISKMHKSLDESFQLYFTNISVE